MSTPKSEADRVEAFLRAERDHLIGKGIHRSKVAVIERVLKSRLNLEGVWTELLDKCPKGNPPGSNWEKWQLVVDRIIEDATACPPSKIKESRGAIDRVAELNFEIAQMAEDLVDLLKKRAMLRIHGDIAVPDDYMPLDLMRRAAELSEDDRTSYLFKNCILPKLDLLDSEFDLKYWPTTTNLLEALAEAQHLEDPRSQDQYVAAATESRQAGNRDFMRVLDKTFDELARPFYVGKRIELSPKSHAALCNTLLGLDDEISTANVKMYRQGRKKRQELTQ